MAHHCAGCSTPAGIEGCPEHARRTRHRDWLDDRLERYHQERAEKDAHAGQCTHEREGHSYLPIAEITRLRNIADTAQAVVDFWEGPPYVTDDDEISREIEHLRRALESA